MLTQKLHKIVEVTLNNKLGENQISFGHAGVCITNPKAKRLGIIEGYGRILFFLEAARIKTSLTFDDIIVIRPEDNKELLLK